MNTRPPPSDRTSLGRRAWRALAPARLRQSAQPAVQWMFERRVQSALRSEPQDISPGPLVVSGLLYEAKGVSEGARLTVAGLRAAGLAPVAHDLRPMFNSGGEFPVNAPGGAWLLHVNAPEAIQALGRIDPVRWLGRYRVGYWAYELPRVPESWVRIAEAFHEIWAPSRFVVDALLASGVKTPVKLMPHPVALGEKPGASDRAAFGIPDDTFTVLALGDLHSSATRKNLVGAIDAFTRAFPSEDAARLIVKVREEGAHPSFLALARQHARGRADITFMTSDLSVSDMRRLVASCDVVLSPHRSEGFGLPLAEAFMAGVPALATDWSGNLEFMSGMPDLLIASTPAPVNDIYRIYRAVGQTWAEPDLDDAATKLRALAASPDLRRKLAEQGRAAVEALSVPWRLEALLETRLGALTAKP